MRNKTVNFTLSDFNISLSQNVETTSFSHFYALISGRRYHISKDFFVLLRCFTGVVDRTVGKQRSDYPNKFYTKPLVSKFCVSTFASNVHVQKKDLIIEPSAGNGSFVQPLKRFNCNKIFLEIVPKSKLIIQADFLTWKPADVLGRVHVIGNPPFGRQSSLYLKFIEHASNFADTFSFVLPATFKRCTMRNRIPLNFELVFEETLP